jgi:hypothetical protein
VVPYRSRRSEKARRERRHGQPLTEQRLPLGFGQRRGSVAACTDGHRASSSARAASMDTPRARRPTTPLDRNGLDSVTSRRSCHREGHDEVGGPVDLQTVENRRHDADHRRRHGIDLDRFADAGTSSRRACGGNPR